MCGRYTSKKNPVDIAEEFHAANLVPQDRRPDYNVAPTREVPVVRAVEGEQTSAAEDERELVTMRWGLVPFWAKDPKVGGRMFNARVETLTSKPAYRSAVKRRRCIVPIDGYYEWKKLDGGKKQPYYMTGRDGASLALAGLWETWGKDEDALTTFTIVTMPSAGHLEEIHDRMPFMLPARSWQQWLAPDEPDVAELLAHPDLARAESLELRPVGADVGKVANNRADLIDEITPDAVLF
ncbi:MAG: SOS response-associated peptidase [Cumulibacter sp.]